MQAEGTARAPTGGNGEGGERGGEEVEGGTDGQDILLFTEGIAYKKMRDATLEQGREGGEGSGTVVRVFVAVQVGVPLRTLAPRRRHSPPP